VTGIAGPGGGTDDKPVGLVHFAYADSGRAVHLEKRFGDLGRQRVREETVKTALGLVLDSLGVPRP
jgi:nicotinamide-nucleotide amidase